MAGKAATRHPRPFEGESEGGNGRGFGTRAKNRNLGSDVAAAAEVEEAQAGDEDDGLEAVEDAEGEVVEEGEAELGAALPPPEPGAGEVEPPRPVAEALLVQLSEPPALAHHGCRRPEAWVAVEESGWNLKGKGVPCFFLGW